MPGLLGNGWDDPQSSANMALAAGLLQGNLGAGFAGASQAYGNAQDSALKRQLVKAQMDNYESEVAQRNAALQAAQRKQAAMATMFQPGGMSGGQPMPQMEGNTPMFSRTMGAAPMQAAPQGLNVQAALQAGYTPDEIQKLDGLRNIGLNKVARTVKATGPDGKEYEYQMDDFGRPVGAPMAQYRAPISVNQGNRTTFADPYNLNPIGSFQTFQGPDSAASNAVAIRGQNMTDARAKATAEMGGIPSGYRRTTTGLEFIPGGPADPNAAKKAAPTEFQGKSTTFGARMQDAAKTIDSLEGTVSPGNVARAGYRPEFPSWMPGGQIASAGISAANKMTTPDDAQRYYQAQENWVTANLRQESGAAIGKDEMAKDIAKWFPQPGDSDAVKQQKASARKVAERAMVVQAGPGASSIPGILGDETPPTAGSSSAVHWRYENGRLVKVK